MFEHFGIKEIWCGIKRNICMLLVITVLFAALGAAYVKYINSSRESATPASGTYAVSQSFLITANKDAPDGSAKAIQADVDCANTLAAMLKADFCKKFVFEQLQQSYSRAQIIKLAGLNISEVNLNFNFLTNIIKADVIANTSILNLYSTSSNQAFSQSITDACVEYLEQNAIPSVELIKNYVKLGGSSVTVDSGSSDKNVGTMSNQLLSMKKYIVIFGVLGFILALCVILVMTLFRPLVASKRDIEEYGIKAYKAGKAKKSDGYSYIADGVICVAKEKSLTSLAIVTGYKQKKGNNDAAVLAEALKKIADAEGLQTLNIELCGNINDSYENFAKAKKCDAVLLAERLGVSCHNDLAGELSLLSQSDTDVIGAALL